MAERIIVWGPWESSPVGKGPTFKRSGIGLEVMKDIISEPKYPIQRQGYLFLLCSLFKEAHDAKRYKEAEEYGILIFEEAGLAPVRRNRDIDLKPVA